MGNLVSREQGWKLIGHCAVEMPLLSENKFTRGKHWASKSAPRHWRLTKKTWMPLLLSESGLGYVIPHNFRRRRVIVIRILHGRERNWDKVNLYGGSVKSVEDALVKLGWLKDDSEDWCDLEAFQIKGSACTGWMEKQYKRGMRTIVKIYDRMKG